MELKRFNRRFCSTTDMCHGLQYYVLATAACMCADDNTRFPPWSFRFRHCLDLGRPHRGMADGHRCHGPWSCSMHGVFGMVAAVWWDGVGNGKERLLDVVRQDRGTMVGSGNLCFFVFRPMYWASRGNFLISIIWKPKCLRWNSSNHVDLFQELLQCERLGAGLKQSRAKQSV